MTEILHANIFFFIASLATIAFGLMVCIAMYHVIKILRLIRTIMERVEAGSDIIAEDIATMRRFVMGGGFVSHLMGMFMRPRKSKGGRKTSKEDIIIDDAD